MHQWLVQAADDGAIHSGVTAFDDELDGLSALARQIAHIAGVAPKHGRNGRQAHAQQIVAHLGRGSTERGQHLLQQGCIAALHVPARQPALEAHQLGVVDDGFGRQIEQAIHFVIGDANRAASVIVRSAKIGAAGLAACRPASPGGAASRRWQPGSTPDGAGAASPAAACRPSHAIG
jgi:hypothetical protein